MLFDDMKIHILQIGKTTEVHVAEGVNKYLKLVSRYVQVEITSLPEPKRSSKLPVNEIKEKEAALLLNECKRFDRIILLDEHGDMMRSKDFATLLQGTFNQSVKSMAFIIGGPHGFSDSVYQQAHVKLSLSRMTFPHQLIRLLFMEQLYRAISIINGLPYHNE
jgi:23S rRNA (pseudouridine1915-N3)-methyltransferase